MTTSAPAINAELFALPPLHAQLKADAREVAAQFAPRAREVRQHLLDHGELHPGLWRIFCERGWSGLVLPSQCGGVDGGLLGMTVVLEAFAEQNVILWMPVLSAAIAHAISQVGPDSARQAWLRRLAAGDVQLAMAATEAHSGHNLFRVATEIRCDGDFFVINGAKSITSGLDVADRVLVFGRPPKLDGRSPGQYTAVLVDPRAPGVTMTELPMRYREGVRQYRLDLDNVRVPRQDLVGDEGAGLTVMWPFTNVERVLTAALCLGMAGYSTIRAIERARQRVIGGKVPIGAHQAMSHPLASLHARREAIRLFVYRTAAAFDDDADGPGVAGAANMAKVLTADLVFDAADHAVQVLGAEAWDERGGWLDVYLDARLSRSGPVSNEFALNFVAEHVLGLPTHP